MVSIFDLINNYQDSIVASVTIVTGFVQIGVSAWAIHSLILAEHLLIYLVGHEINKKTKSIQEAMDHYPLIKQFLRNDLFGTIDIIKIAFSVALIAGVFQALGSLMMIFLRGKPYARKIWIALEGLALAGLVGGFGLGMQNFFLVHNTLFLQIFLATTGMNLFLLLHLIGALLLQELCGSGPDDKNEDGSTNSTVSTVATTLSEERSAVVAVETQTPSIAVAMQEEFPLPPTPPAPSSDTTSTNSTSTSSTSSGPSQSGANPRS